jgi:hypothetical protein
MIIALIAIVGIIILHFETLGIEGNIGGMGCDSHPSKMVCYFNFLTTLS